MKKDQIKKTAKKQLKELFSLDMILFIIFLLAIRSSVLGTYKVPTGSMIPSIKVHDHLFANKLSYNFKIPFTDYQLIKWRDPKKGDIIAFRNPQNEREMFTKRVIAEPGDTLEIKNRKLIINGKTCKYEFVRIETEFHFSFEGEYKENTITDIEAAKISAYDIQDGSIYYKGKLLDQRASYYAVYNEYFGEESHKVRFRIRKIIIDGKDTFIGLIDDNIKITNNTVFINDIKIPNGIINIIKEYSFKNPDTGNLQTLMLEELITHPDFSIGKDGRLYYKKKEINCKITQSAALPGNAFEDNMSQITINDNCYFAMGDNRNNSHDSRFWGQLNRTNIEGKLLIRWLAFKGHTWIPEIGRLGLIN